MVLLTNPLSVQGVLGLVLSVLLEGIVPQDDTRGRTRDPALPLPVGGSVLSPPHRLVNASPLLAVRGVIAVVPLTAEDGTHQMIVPDHVVEALAKGLVDVVGALLLHDAERRAFLDLLPRKVGGAKEALAIVPVALAVGPQSMEAAWTSVAVA